MRLGPIVLKIRLANTRFGRRVGGTVELDLAIRFALTDEMAFVVPISEECKANEYENAINQEITEQFGVIVALKNDTYQQDKLGLTAYDMLHDTRSEIWEAILGWEMSDAESMVYYRGGSILMVTPAYLWYMFRYEYTSRILSRNGRIDPTVGAALTSRDVVGISTVIDADVNNPESPMHVSNRAVTGMTNRGFLDISQLPSFDRLYAQYLLGDDVRLYDGSVEGLPMDDGYPDVTLPDQAQWLDLTANPNAGEFWRGFANAFDTYKFK